MTDVRYQVLWDNRPSNFAQPKRSKTAAAAAPKHDPVFNGPGELHSSENGLFGHINFAAEYGREARLWVNRLKGQGYLGVTLWDTRCNPLSELFPLG